MAHRGGYYLVIHNTSSSRQKLSSKRWVICPKGLPCVFSQTSCPVKDGSFVQKALCVLTNITASEVPTHFCRLFSPCLTRTVCSLHRLLLLQNETSKMSHLGQAHHLLISPQWLYVTDAHHKVRTVE